VSPEVPEIHSGWGLNLKAYGFSAKNFDEIRSLRENQNVRGAIPSGLNRSYGDSSISSGGVRFMSTNYTGISIDALTGIAECGSGVLIRDLEYEAQSKGFLPPVVPGTSFVTLGGAFASDIHGKSQQTDGNFSDHVTSISIIDDLGFERKFTSGSEEFKATAGGMGLTGFISRLEIKLKKVDIPIIYQEEVRARNLSEILSTLEGLEAHYPYTVAWIDLSGRYQGRGLISGGRFALEHEVSKAKKFKLGFKKSSRVMSVPFLGYLNFMKYPSIRLFNEFWYRKPLKTGLSTFTKFMHPLDSIGNWNQIYGQAGFIQYQLVIPDENREVLHQVLSLLKRNKVSSFLTVLKKFGHKGSGYLSFPMPGWTLAMDFASNSNNLSQVIQALDELVINSGGRVYLTKDSTSSPDSIEIMYSNLEKWKSIKKRMDPSNFWQSDQSRRLNLC
jgi:decaprenylphospho-beta-D-ribofuranose 2-oxidase